MMMDLIGMGLIFIGLFFIGPLKPDVEEKVAEFHLFCSLVHLSPPLYSPQELHAVRQATPKVAPPPLFFRSEF